MRGRSWMAALALVAAVGVGVGPSASFAAGPAPIKQQVKLNIRLDGTSKDSGVEIVIKPGHPACRFKTIIYPVKGDGLIQDIPPIDVETLSADRDCSFAIVLKEPGQPDKVFRRSLQINGPTQAGDGKPQSLLCYLSSRTASNKTPMATNPVATKPAAPDAAQKR